MKNPILAAIPALVLVGIASAQNSMDSVPADSGYTVAAKSPHSRTWRRVTLDTDPVTGDVVTKTNSYTELKTGMHRFVAGQFVEASDQLSVTQTGAEATNSQCQIRFLGNINAPQAVQLTLPGGGTNRLVSNV